MWSKASLQSHSLGAAFDPRGYPIDTLDLSALEYPGEYPGAGLELVKHCFPLSGGGAGLALGRTHAELEWRRVL
jgi:hypothetical protein